MSNTKNKPGVREKALEHGVEALFDEELIAIILGTGTKNSPINIMSLRIADRLDSIDGNKIIPELMKLKGVGEGKALAVAASLELGKRRSRHLKAPIRSPIDIVPFVKNYSVSQKEHFLVITLNGSHEIIEIHCVTIGTLNKTLIHPREVFSLAIKENAAAIIVCHNHPSGNCEPSREDIDATQMLKNAAMILGIELLDHIIVSRESHFSFMENNLLFTEVE